MSPGKNDLLYNDVDNVDAGTSRASVCLCPVLLLGKIASSAIF